jgi:hypothetical protein
MADPDPGPLVVTEMIVARIEARAAELPAAGVDLAEEILIVRDYLRQHQDKGLRQFAEAELLRKLGERGPISDHVVNSVAERMRNDFDGSIGQGLEDCVKANCAAIEQKCADLHLPLHSGVAAGIVFGP